MPDKTHGSLAAEAAAYLTESAGAVSGFNGIQPEIRRQADCLIEWSKKRGVFLSDSRIEELTRGLVNYERGTSEHIAYFGRPDGRVIKFTKPGKFGLGHGANGKYGNHCDATPLFYLQRIELMNQEFPTDIRFEGMALGASKGGVQPYMVTSQRFIEKTDKNHTHPSEEEIERFMVGLGFRLVDGSVYNWVRESDGIIVTDAKELNFVNSHEGIVPIDVIIGKKV